ncbi:ABC transporter permease [Neobacillus sp. PS3-12]|uniref:ABC transporter permease n=1 Tax=Neobacillus sp. PS3-12 TaxID=3070677 RepID=UPI0027DF5EB7|nr:ABC transporter permease [Neobacillus sp. PS3-12]WML54811.1 ABC transporter permease [Neobacillus sp. PS3-12]
MKRKNFTLTEKYLAAIIVLYCIVVGIINPAFLSFETLFDMFRASSGTMILGMGVLVMLISGGIDVSFTAIAIFGGYTVTRILISTGIDNLFVAFVISCGIGVVLGLINALIVHFFKLQTLIVTLGTSAVFYGIMTTFIGTQNIGATSMPKVLTQFGEAYLFQMTGKDHTPVGISMFVIPVILIMFITWFILYRTMIGRGVFALGNSEESAIRAGFRPLLIRLFVFSFIGFLSGVMGIIYVAQVNAVNPISLVGSELTIIAAVVIGGQN